MKKLFLLRHGEAAMTRPDWDRKLTATGIQDLERVLAGVPESPDIILASPYLRTRQTAEIAQRLWNVTQEVVISQALLPDSTPESLWDEARTLGQDSVLVVTHQPLISQAAAWILGESSTYAFTLGTLCAIAVSTSGARPTAKLEWLRTP